MSTFAYTAIGKDGKRTSGTLAADSRSAAIAEVTRQGLHPLKVDEQANGKKGPATNGHAKTTLKAPAKASPAGKKTPASKKASADVSPAGRPFGFGAAAAPGRVSGKAVESFTRDLANLLGGGVPLARALSLLKREASTPGAKFLWGEIHDDVVGGTGLADALGKWPKAFSGVYVAMVRAGEAGGFLDVVLQQIADFRTREADLKGKVKAALVYPAVLAILAVCVVIFLMIYFIPKFSEIFTGFGTELPLITQIIVGVSNAVRNYGLFIAGGVFVGVVALARAAKTDTGRRRIEQVMLAAPGFGRVTAHFALVRFCRMLGTLVGAGVPLVASLRTAREAIGNQTLADTVATAIEEVQRGEPLSASLAASPRLFPASVIETVAVAEETGRLDKELVRIAGSYEQDLERQLRMLVSVVEPLLLISMASVIGVIVVGMLLPIFNLQQMVK